MIARLIQDFTRWKISNRLRNQKVLCLSVILMVVLNPTDAEFVRLQQVLEKYNFKIRIEATPIRGTYGLLESSTKTIWINPVVFDLGIARPTLVHEAVHAAQNCYGGNQLQPLGLEMSPPAMTRRYFIDYPPDRRQLEAEAYTIQVQPDGVDLVISLLHKYCQK